MQQPLARIAEIVSKGRVVQCPDVTPGRRYLLYGAGRLGRTILNVLEKMNVEVVGFIDQRAVPDAKLEHIAVELPDSPRVRQLYAQSDGIIVSAYNHHANLRDIFLALRRLGYEKVYAAPDLVRTLPPGALPLDYWLDLADVVPRSDELVTHLTEAYAMLADELSRELLLDLIKLRLSGDYAMAESRIHSPDLDRQYFPADLPVKIDARRMIDCGAYNGDSLRAAYRLVPPVERVACFEPDPENFKKLVESVRAQPGPAEIELFPLAVWNENKVLSFSASRETGSAVSPENPSARAENKVSIQAVRLDDVLCGFHPTLIKMDIEGVEPEALQGAARLIAESRPQLAICIYHKLRDYWEIPRLIQSLCSEYRLYLRQHGHNGQETVLYALTD